MPTNNKPMSTNGRNKRKKQADLNPIGDQCMATDVENDQHERNPDECRKLARLQSNEGLFREDDPKASEVLCGEYYINSEYCKTKLNDEVYAKNMEGDEFINTEEEKYAVRHIQNANGDIEQIETLPKKKDDLEFYMEKNGQIIYPENLTQKRVILKKDPLTGEEQYDKNDQGDFFYPTKKDGGQSYRVDSQGREVPIIKIGYAKDKDQTEIYPKDETKKERYLMNLDTEEPSDIAARKHDGSLYYAKDANGDEYYPKKYVDKFNFVYPYFMEEKVRELYPLEEPDELIADNVNDEKVDEKR